MQHWVEMSSLCEAVVRDQITYRLEELEYSEPLISVTGLQEISVKHPILPLNASAVSDGREWFMCVISADPVVKVSEADALIGAWSGVQDNLIQTTEFFGAIFNDGKTFQPVRVQCNEDDQMTVVLAFRAENDEFRIGVTNRLPDNVESPC